MDPCTKNLKGNGKPGNHDEKRSSKRETKGDKPGNQDETRSNRREAKGDKPGNHDETRSSRRETKGDKPGNHVATKYVCLQEFKTPSAEAVWGIIKYNKLSKSQTSHLRQATYQPKSPGRPLVLSEPDERNSRGLRLALLWVA